MVAVRNGGSLSMRLRSAAAPGAGREGAGPLAPLTAVAGSEPAGSEATGTIAEGFRATPAGSGAAADRWDRTNDTTPRAASTAHTIVPPAIAWRRNIVVARCRNA